MELRLREGILFLGIKVGAGVRILSVPPAGAGVRIQGTSFGQGLAGEKKAQGQSRETKREEDGRGDQVHGLSIKGPAKIAREFSFVI